MENKQMVHIASEIVVLFGLTFYFNQKNKKLMSHIEDLAQKVEEQDDLLQKHEQVIKKMVEFINQNPSPQSVLVQTQHHKPKKILAKEVHTKPPLTVRKQPMKESPQKVSFKTDIPKETKVEQYTEEEEEEDESDLDAELAEELRELEEEEVEEINITGLKKTI
jgi:hypothetical protein